MRVPTFDEFMDRNSRHGKYRDSDTAREVYNFLSEPGTIQAMIEQNDHEGRPALFGALALLEDRWDGRSDFEFNEKFVRQTVGVMVKAILEPFGYESLIQRDMPRGRFKYFTSAMCYAQVPHQKRLQIITQYAIAPYS